MRQIVGGEPGRHALRKDWRMPDYDLEVLITVRMIAVLVGVIVLELAVLCLLVAFT